MDTSLGLESAPLDLWAGRLCSPTAMVGKSTGAPESWNRGARRACGQFLLGTTACRQPPPCRRSCSDDQSSMRRHLAICRIATTLGRSCPPLYQCLRIPLGRRGTPPESLASPTGVAHGIGATLPGWKLLHWKLRANPLVIGDTPAW